MFLDDFLVSIYLPAHNLYLSNHCEDQGEDDIDHVIGTHLQPKGVGQIGMNLLKIRYKT